MKIANVWSTVARFSDTPVNGLVSHSTTVSTGASSLNGVMSWQFRGRNWWKSGGTVQDPSIGIWYMLLPSGSIAGLAARNASKLACLLVVRGVIGDHARRSCQGLVEGEQDRQLEEERQTAAEHVHAVLAVERGRLLADLPLVALVLALDLPDQRLHPLHLLLGANLADEQRGEQGPDDDGQDDDRQRQIVEEELVESPIRALKRGEVVAGGLRPRSRGIRRRESTRRS